MKALVQKALARYGYTITSASDLGPPDYGHIYRAVSPYTMTNFARVTALCDAVDYLTRSGITGDFVECGVWRGGSMMAAALVAMERGQLRDLWLYDTFDGMTEPDAQKDGKEALQRYLESKPRGSGSDWCLASLEDVTANLDSTGYPMERVKFLRGKVEETIPVESPERIALLRLDTDWYESTLLELERLAPKIVDGGVLIIDDYGRWEGARRAVEEWLEHWEEPIVFHRIDPSARMAVIQRA